MSTFLILVWVSNRHDTVPGEPTPRATRNGAACPAQTRRLDRTTCRRGSAAELAVSPGLAATRLKPSSPSAAALWHGEPPRLTKSRNHPAGSPPRRRPQTRRSYFSRRGPLASAIREAGCSTIARPSGQGNRDFAGEARWCVARRSTRGPAVQGCDSPSLDGPAPPAGGWGAPQPGRRATTAAWASLRGAETLPGWDTSAKPTQLS